MPRVVDARQRVRRRRRGGVSAVVVRHTADPGRVTVTLEHEAFR